MAELRLKLAVAMRSIQADQCSSEWKFIIEDCINKARSYYQDTYDRNQSGITKSTFPKLYQMIQKGIPEFKPIRLMFEDFADGQQVFGRYELLSKLEEILGKMAKAEVDKLRLALDKETEEEKFGLKRIKAVLNGGYSSWDTMWSYFGYNTMGTDNTSDREKTEQRTRKKRGDEKSFYLASYGSFGEHEPQARR
eukprot:CAMPEP_0167762924 /NCGR_PEP_ID=MMETSP0110_2-20121227/13057_1 /TAXON_ID=629695 /ORGANISM="Gymnochlora sp., Strain CCMP2014" /LENGTH=193 /DNA_ID=CAMNT_0007649891 /DNA_START=524 /DNA_END=1105 /DNA_ORIENTATION=+